MSLDYDATQVKQWNTLTEQQKRIITHGIVWHAMLCGFGSITEKNVEEVYRRIAFWERVNGALLKFTFDETAYPIKREDVTVAIGLKTNVADLTKAQFTKRVWDAYNDQLNLDAVRAKRDGRL